jgi:dihydroxyacetone synthase
LTNTEDVDAKMRACGWNVLNIEDGCFDIHGIVNALNQAKKSDKPTFINVKTVIGLGSAVAGDPAAHGAAFGMQDVANMKTTYGFDREDSFVIPEVVRDFFADRVPRGQDLVKQWEDLFGRYAQSHPDLAREFRSRMNGELPANWESLIPKEFPAKNTSTRASSGLVFNPIAQACKQFLVGTADLSPSVYMTWNGREDFEPRQLGTGSYAGRYIHYGVREHAMAAISNGIAAYHPGMFIPVTSSFFIFYLYAAPAVRMGALQHLQVIHAATHDSIGMGEDGPTHQPIELAALYRAMPNLLYIRPGDSEETAGAWEVAIKARHTPSIISTSRHALPQLTPLTKRTEVAKGAYILKESSGEADLTLLGVGAELGLAIDVAKLLEEKYHHRVRIVSFPCQRLFEKQPLEYQRSVLGRRHTHTQAPIIVIEPYAANGWERYANAAVCLSKDRFGQSLPGPTAYEFFGFEASFVSQRIHAYLESLEADPLLRSEFVEMTHVGLPEANGH